MSKQIERVWICRRCNAASGMLDRECVACGMKRTKRSPVGTWDKEAEEFIEDAHRAD